jgi:hypothetical protein
MIQQGQAVTKTHSRDRTMDGEKSIAMHTNPQGWDVQRASGSWDVTRRFQYFFHYQNVRYGMI